MKLVGDMGGFPSSGIIVPASTRAGDLALYQRADYATALGTEVTIQLTHIPVISQGTPIEIFKNGSLLFYGSDYTISGSKVTLNVAASTGDKFLTKYWSNRMQGSSSLIQPPFTALGFGTSFQTNLTYSTGAVSNDTATNAFSGIWYTGRSATSHADGTGKWQAELVHNAAANNLLIFGLIATTSNGNSYIGSGTLGNAAGYQCSGAMWIEGVFANPGTSGSTSTTGTTQAVLIGADMTARKGWLKLSSSGTFIGGGDPTLGTNPTFTWSAAETLHIGCSLDGPTASATLNTGGAAFVNSAISGFSLWG